MMRVAVPPVVEVAVTVAVIELPGRTVKPVKSWAKSGNHSNQAAGRGERGREAEAW